MQAEAGNQSVDQPTELALPWHNGDSPNRIDLVPVDTDLVDEETEDDPTDVTVLWNSEEQQSPPEDSNSEDSLAWYDDEPGSSRQQDVNQTTPAAAARGLDQEKSSAASSPEEQQDERPAEPTNKRIDASASSFSASPAGDLAEAAHDDQVPADEPPDELDDDLYEGTVRLLVTSSGPVKNLLNFVGELRQNTQLRLLRLVANQRSESMDIWLGLREPLQLITILGDIPVVSRVAAVPDSGEDEEERRVTVEVGQ